MLRFKLDHLSPLSKTWKTLIKAVFTLKYNSTFNRNAVRNIRSKIFPEYVSHFNVVSNTATQKSTIYVYHDNLLLVKLIDVTLACEDTNSKLVDIVTVANVDDEDCIGNSLLQIWELRIVHKAKLFFSNLSSQICNKLLSTRSSS